MKKNSRLFVSAAALSLTLGMMPQMAMAQDNYDYTLTFSAIGQAEFSSAAFVSAPASAEVSYTENTFTVSGLNYGDQVRVYPSSLGSSATLEMANDKYEVSGIRIAGHNDVMASTVINVTKDQDYVVAYYLPSDLVMYTVYYQAADGTTLLDSETFYGNVGDTPVIAYRYVEGYTPDYEVVTRALSANAEENDFTFTYTVIPENQVVTETTTVITVPGADNTADAGAGGAAGGAGAGGAAAGGVDAGGADAGGADAGADNGTNIEDENVPLNPGDGRGDDADENTVIDDGTTDITDDGVPLDPGNNAGGQNNGSDTKSSIAPIAAGAGIGAVALAGIIGVIVLAVKRKKNS